MSKHKKAGDKREEVGKAGSPPSGTENEKPREEKDDRARVPKTKKDKSGGVDEGRPLH
jgi:hypothetical protein